MDNAKVDTFLMTHGKFFPQEKMMLVRERLQGLDDAKFSTLISLDFQDPTTLLIVSIFLGALGVDRFMLGQTGLGIGKLLTTVFTCGIVGGIWQFIDMFLIMGATKQANFEKFSLRVV